eukprot:1161643-Pelagomonas_calceolata.AAC.12
MVSLSVGPSFVKAKPVCLIGEALATLLLFSGHGIRPGWAVLYYSLVSGRLSSGLAGNTQVSSTSAVSSSCFVNCTRYLSPCTE